MPDMPILQVNGLHKSFSGIVAARNINVSVSPGEIIGIIGANGAGKTVFVNMITGYLKPTSGTIWFSGTDITGIEPREATHVGVCRSFQISQVFMTMTVRENLIIALAIARHKGWKMLRSIDDVELVKSCDEIMAQFRINVHAESVVNTLSQGVRKLLDIAMAVVAQPRVLLLDEPTSGVSAEEKFQIMDIVISALKNSGTAVLFVEHDMDIVARYVDRVLAFYQGEIICDETPQEALSDPKVLEYVIGEPAADTALPEDDKKEVARAGS